MPIHRAVANQGEQHMRRGGVVRGGLLPDRSAGIHAGQLRAFEVSDRGGVISAISISPPH